MKVFEETQNYIHAYGIPHIRKTFFFEYARSGEIEQI